MKTNSKFTATALALGLIALSTPMAAGDAWAVTEKCCCSGKKETWNNPPQNPDGTYSIPANKKPDVSGNVLLGGCAAGKSDSYTSVIGKKCSELTGHFDGVTVATLGTSISKVSGSKCTVKTKGVACPDPNGLPFPPEFEEWSAPAGLSF